MVILRVADTLIRLFVNHKFKKPCTVGNEGLHFVKKKKETELSLVESLNYYSGTESAEK